LLTRCDQVPKLTKNEGGKEAKQGSEKKLKKGFIMKAEKAAKATEKATKKGKMAKKAAAKDGTAMKGTKKEGTTMKVDSEDTSLVETAKKGGKKRTRAFRL
jgi:hypothetical protein